MDAGQSPTRTVYFHIRNYEEVVYGALSGIPAEVAELVTVDMAVVGPGQESDEFHATLCIKDSGGVYHEGLTRNCANWPKPMGSLIKRMSIDIMAPTGEAFWRAGGDVAVALIGPGIDASHNYERTHTDGLVATT